MMGCVHTRQLHFDPQIINLNVSITSQNSTVSVMREARSENLMAIKYHDCLKQILLFLQTCRNNLFFKKTVSLIRQNSI